MWKLNYRRTIPIIRPYIARNLTTEEKALSVDRDTLNATFDLPSRSKSELKVNVNTISDVQRDNVEVLIDPKKDSNIKLIVPNTVPVTKESREAVPFDEVPGPSVLRYISKAWSYIPDIGNQVTLSTLQYVLSAGKIFGSQLSWGNNLTIFKYLLNEYGPVVRLHGPFGGNVVILSRPEHAKTIFQNEGPYPIRSSLDCLEKYRLENRMYRQTGPFLMHGTQWAELRKTIEPAVSKSLNVNHDKMQLAADDFIHRVFAIRNKQEEVPKSFQDEITKWCMECLFNVMLNKKMGFLDPKGLSPTSEIGILLEAFKDATESIKKCEFGFHMWKFYETPSWKKLVMNCDVIDHILSNYLRQAQENIAERTKTAKTTKANPEYFSLIENLLLTETLIGEDIITIFLDMLLLGVNKTTHTAGFLMYHLAKNQRAQYNLYQEILKLPVKVTKDHLRSLKYLKACVNESLRLKPPMPVLSRILTEEMIVHGYKIPKDTYVLIATNLSSLREEHFEDPMKFKPERWLGNELNEDVEALASIPFGHGPKACLAKDLAEVQLYYLTIAILRKFRIEYHYGDIESNNKLLASPSRPLKFRFVNRTK